MQLTSRSDTERFLATKIPTLDTSLRDVSRVKEETETTLPTENRQLRESNESLKAYAEARDVLIADLQSQIETLEADNQELAAAGLGITKEELVEEIQRLEIEWATARTGAAVLEVQLKKKIETEHSLACQVSGQGAPVVEEPVAEIPVVQDPVEETVLVQRQHGWRIEMLRVTQQPSNQFSLLADSNP